MTDEEPEPTENTDDWPQREVRDVNALRALAHPLRLRLIELLGVHGPATATELAERVGHSPANCSWHLRQLAAGGFIEEAEGGTGRQRVWKFVPTGHTYGYSDDDPDLTEAATIASAIQLEHEVGEFRQWRAAKDSEPAEWRDAAFVSQSIVWLTAAELDDLNDEIKKVYLRHIQRHFEAETRPADSRPVRLVAWGVPAKNLEPDT